MSRTSRKSRNTMSKSKAPWLHHVRHRQPVVRGRLQHVAAPVEVGGAEARIADGLEEGGVQELLVGSRATPPESVVVEVTVAREVGLVQRRGAVLGQRGPGALPDPP